MAQSVCRLVFVCHHQKYRAAVVVSYIYFSIWSCPKKKRWNRQKSSIFNEAMIVYLVWRARSCCWAVEIITANSRDRSAFSSRCHRLFIHTHRVRLGLLLLAKWKCRLRREFRPRPDGLVALWPNPAVFFLSIITIYNIITRSNLVDMFSCVSSVSKCVLRDIFNPLMAIQDFLAKEKYGARDAYFQSRLLAVCGASFQPVARRVYAYSIDDGGCLFDDVLCVCSVYSRCL